VALLVGASRPIPVALPEVYLQRAALAEWPVPVGAGRVPVALPEAYPQRAALAE